MKYVKIIFIVFTLFPFHLSAETAEEKGLRIAKASYENGRGFTDMVSDQLMILIDPKGNEVTREVSGKTLENLDPNDGDKSLTYFKTPKDVEGTVMLSHTHISDDDDQWLYLPALGRVKRISSSNKSGAFMGSEVAFEDFSGTDYRKYEWKFLGEEIENNENLKKSINDESKILSFKIDLKNINLKLWNIEDGKRLAEKNSQFDEKFIELARSVYKFNDERAKIKLAINNALGSNIKEVKSYE